MSELLKLIEQTDTANPLSARNVTGKTKHMKGKIKMTQDKAQEIIRNTYGSSAYAIGHTEDGENVTIFYLYAGEDESEYKAHEVKS